MTRTYRKLIIYAIAVVALLAGLLLCLIDELAPHYVAFAGGLAAITTAAMAGNAAEHFAARAPHEVP